MGEERGEERAVSRITEWKRVRRREDKLPYIGMGIVMVKGRGTKDRVSSLSAFP